MNSKRNTNFQTAKKKVQLEKINLSSEIQGLKQKLKLTQEEFEASSQKQDNEYKI
jgi:hypothetical protein